MLRRAGLLILVVVAVAVLTSCNRHSFRASVPPSEVTRQYASGGTVRIDLPRGNLEVTGTPGDKVVARCVEGCESTLHLNTEGEARIWIDSPAGKTFGPGPKYVIEVPDASDLYVHLAAGNLTLGGVKGNKDVILNAGNATLAIGHADDYGRVDLRVTAGTLAAGPWSAFAAGLVQNVNKTGEGKYALHAVVNAGNLVINGEKAAESEKHDSML